MTLIEVPPPAARPWTPSSKHPTTYGLASICRKIEPGFCLPSPDRTVTAAMPESASDDLAEAGRRSTRLARVAAAAGWRRHPAGPGPARPDGGRVGADRGWVAGPTSG